MHESKAHLRSHLRSLRNSLPHGLRSLLSARIIETLKSHPWYCSARQPAFTASIGSEVETRDLLTERYRAGMPVLLPRMLCDKTMEFHQVLGSPGALALSDLGIPEPDFDRDAIVPPEEIDLFVMPGVGFDPWGNRLGQGRGFFDQYLSRLPRPARKIGLAFDCQMVEQLPCGEADIPVDLVMTERTVYQVEECEWVSESVDQTHKLAGIVAGQIQPPAVLRLSGELGAGKTEWVRGFLGSLGWKGRVRSPTFALEHVYSFGERARVYHLDGYRLDAPSELDLDRLREIEEDPLSIILVEWPERFGEEFSPFSAHLYFEWTGENRRRIRYRAYETRNHLNLEPAKAG